MPVLEKPHSRDYLAKRSCLLLRNVFALVAEVNKKGHRVRWPSEELCICLLGVLSPSGGNGTPARTWSFLTGRAIRGHLFMGTTAAREREYHILKWMRNFDAEHGCFALQAIPILDSICHIDLCRFVLLSEKKNFRMANETCVLNPIIVITRPAVVPESLTQCLLQQGTPLRCHAFHGNPSFSYGKCLELSGADNTI